jgi:hypothetical protein
MAAEVIPNYGWFGLLDTSNGDLAKQGVNRASG